MSFYFIMNFVVLNQFKNFAVKQNEYDGIKKALLFFLSACAQLEK